MLDVGGILYCWTLLNVAQPSYGWTRTLMAPDAEHGLVPAATSHQLRVYGAYSRRNPRRHDARRGGQFERAASGDGVQRKAGRANAGDAEPVHGGSEVSVTWPGGAFRYMEVASPQREKCRGASGARRRDCAAGRDRDADERRAGAGGRLNRIQGRASTLRKVLMVE